MSARRHIVIAVTPVLLGDTLSRSLNSEETEVTVITGEAAAASGTHADVLIVSGVEPDLTADVVIHLADQGDVAVVRSPGRTEQLPIRNLSGLVAVFQRYAESRHVPESGRSPSSDRDG